MKKSVPQMGFLEENLKSILDGGSKNCYNQPGLPSPPPPERTKSGDVTVRIGGALIAGSVNPKAEGVKFAEAVAASHKDGGSFERIVVYGLGLGYHIEALLDRTPPIKKIVVMEANPEILSAALHHRSLKDLFSDERVRIITDPDEDHLLRKLGNETGEGGIDWEVAVHLPSFRAIPERFTKIASIFESMLAERRFKARFSDIERRNIRANLAALASSPGAVTALREWFSSVKDVKSAVLVGAGPSLDRNLPFLLAAQKRTFILAVDTAALTLTTNGIDFDAVVTVDPQPMSAVHFGDGFTEPLLFAPASHPYAVSLHSGKRLYFVKKGHSIFGPAEKLYEGENIIDAGGSVSCFGLELLAKAGAKKIGLVGLDFAYPGGIPYNRGTLAGYSDAGEIMDDEGIGALMVTAEHKPVETTLTDGRKGFTHRHLDGYRKTAEELISRHPRVAFYNLDSSGARIKGCAEVRSRSEAGAILLGQNRNEARFTAETKSHDMAFEENLRKALGL